MEMSDATTTIVMVVCVAVVVVDIDQSGYQWLPLSLFSLGPNRSGEKGSNLQQHLTNSGIGEISPILSLFESKQF